jgi:hypothetical protein
MTDTAGMRLLERVPTREAAASHAVVLGLAAGAPS